MEKVKAFLKFILKKSVKGNSFETLSFRNAKK